VSSSLLSGHLVWRSIVSTSGLHDKTHLWVGCFGFISGLRVFEHRQRARQAIGEAQDYSRFVIMIPLESIHASGLCFLQTGGDTASLEHCLSKTPPDLCILLLTDRGGKCLRQSQCTSYANLPSKTNSSMACVLWPSCFSTSPSGNLFALPSIAATRCTCT
jgi:hypothetical protein